MAKTIIDKELADAIDAPLALSAEIPCERCVHADSDVNSCLEKERGWRARDGKRKGWHQYDVKNMCASCACYWHLSCARNFALGVVR